MKIKIRAFDGAKMITEESSTLKSYQILQRYLSIMLFTGLKDSDNTEIYEGDILNAIEPKRNFTVFFTDGSFHVNNKQGEKYLLSVFLKNRKIKNFDTEIVGNIYETMEL